MSQTLPGGPRTARYVTAAALAATLALPGIASAEVTTTHVSSPTEDTVLDSVGTAFTNEIGDEPLTVTGVAPGAADGDELLLACTYTGNGVAIAIPMGTATVADGAFSETVRSPTYTCRVRALPADLLADEGFDFNPDTDLSSYTGPRVLGGGFGSMRIDGMGEWLDGADVFQSVRGQRNGLVMTGSLSSAFTLFGGFTGGIFASALIEDTYLRILFGPSGVLGTFGLSGPSGLPVDLANAGLVVDGLPAAVVPAVGDQRARLVSRSLDRATGGVTIVETSPVGQIEGGADNPSLQPSGISIRRTYRQDLDGRQMTFTDEFRSDDGRAHRIEARYNQSLYSVYTDEEDESITKEPASFRLPWATGDKYIVPEGGETFGAAPPGRTTIWVHGPRQDYSSLHDNQPQSRVRAAAIGDLPARAEGAITFADAPTDVKFLNRAAFVMRFVRTVPAGRSTVLTHTYSQHLDPDGLEELVGGTPPSAVLPAPPVTTPLPAAPAPPPVTPPLCVTPFVSLIDIDATGTRQRPRTRLVGVASPLLAGKTVRVRRDGRQVAKGRVGNGGTIRMTVAAPTNARARAKARYRLVVDSFRSRALKATRQATITQQKVLNGGRVSVRGRIANTGRARTLSVTGQATCGDLRQSTRSVKTDRHGRFRVVLAPPTGVAPAIIYRLRVAGAKTTTLPVVVGRR